MNKFNLPKEEWVSLLKGGLVAVAGAGLTYLSQHLTATEFGVYTPLVVAVLSVLVNYTRKIVVTPPVVAPIITPLVAPPIVVVPPVEQK